MRYQVVTTIKLWSCLIATKIFLQLAKHNHFVTYFQISNIREITIAEAFPLIYLQLVCCSSVDRNRISHFTTTHTSSCSRNFADYIFIINRSVVIKSVNCSQSLCYSIRIPFATRSSGYGKTTDINRLSRIGTCYGGGTCG